jgi:hypothetical protein
MSQWECNDPNHWYNPEAGWVECETCCGHAMDLVYERERCTVCDSLDCTPNTEQAQALKELKKSLPKIRTTEPQSDKRPSRNHLRLWCKCGAKGPWWPRDGDHAGWMCQKCYEELQERKP